MKKDPAFLFYSKDWIEGTAELMPDEKGVYIDLLCHQHQKDGLPTCTKRLARLVGLSEDEFLPIWEQLKSKFNETDNRLVNHRLNQEMNERSARSLKNTITGTFAGMLRLGKFDADTYNYLKNSFKVDDFISYEKDDITKRLTEWLNECLKSIEDENEDIILKEKEDINKEYSILNPRPAKDKNSIKAALQKRRDELYNSLKPFTDKYPKEMLREFFDHWAELNKSGTKMRIDSENFFDIAKRLATWERNSRNRKQSFSKNGQTEIVYTAPKVKTDWK